MVKRAHRETNCLNLRNDSMAKYLSDIVLSSGKDFDPEFRFRFQIHFLEQLYIDHLPKVLTNGIFKVIIEACGVLPPKKIDNMVDVLKLNKLFDFETYFAAGKETRKRIALEFLQDGLLEVAAIRDWETNPFHEAYKAVLAKNFVCYRPWSKPVTSPDRRYKAEVWCNFDSDKAEIFIVVFHRKEVMRKALVTTVKPGNVSIRGAIGKLEWLSADKVQLSPRDGKNAWGAKKGTGIFTVSK